MANTKVIALIIVASISFWVNFKDKLHDAYSSPRINVDVRQSQDSVFTEVTLTQEKSPYVVKKPLDNTYQDEHVNVGLVRSYSDIELYQMGLSPELYQQIQNRFTIEGQSFAFNYSHWVELSGYINGEPILNITNLNSFTPDSYEKTANLYEYVLDKLSQNESLGKYAPEIETRFDEVFYNFVNKVDVAQINIVNCRELFCAISFSKNSETEISFEKVHSAMINLMSSESVSCKRVQLVGPKDVNIGTTEYYFLYQCSSN